MDGTFQLPRTRRRSSILPRRSIGPAIPAVSTTDADATSAVSESATFQPQPPSANFHRAEDTSHLQSHIKELKAELDSWKNLRSERKLLNHPGNRKTSPPQLSWESAHEFLSEEDISLLKSGPPIGQIREDYDRLVKEAAFLRIKYDRCVHLSSGIERLVQSRFNTIKKDIGEYSEKNDGGHHV